MARNDLEAEGVIDFDESSAPLAADILRRLGSPRRRAADVAIAAVAISRDARLLTGNVRDYSGINELLTGPAREQ